MIIDVSNKMGKHRIRGEVTAEELLAQMDEAGVDMAVIRSFAESLDNESILNAVRRYPDRFVGLYTVNPWDEKAAKEFEHSLSIGFSGLYMNPFRHGYILMEHEIIYPLLEVCRRYKVPVWIHSLAEVNCSPVFLNEIAQDYCDVDIIMGGMGLNYDNTSAIRAAKLHRNIYLESSRAIKMNITRALEEVGANRLMMGTETPDGNYFELEIKKMSRALEDYSDSDKEAVFYKTAAQLFKLEDRIR